MPSLRDCAETPSRPHPALSLRALEEGPEESARPAPESDGLGWKPKCQIAQGILGNIHECFSLSVVSSANPGHPRGVNAAGCAGWRRSVAAPLGAHGRPRLQHGAGVAFSGEVVSRAPVTRERWVKERPPSRRRSSEKQARAGAPGPSRALSPGLFTSFSLISIPGGFIFLSHLVFLV